MEGSFPHASKANEMQFVPLWTSILKSKKIGSLSSDEGWFWTRCLVSAQDHDHKNGTLPSIDDLAYSLHMEVTEVTRLITALVAKGFVTDVRGCYAIHDWQDWRYKPDPTNAERQRRFVAKEKARKEVKEPEKVTPITVSPLNNEITPQHTLTEINRDKGGVPPPAPAIRSASGEADKRAIAIAAERWGASNGDAVVGDLLRTYEPDLVMAAMDKHFDAAGAKFKPAMLRGICRGMFNDGWTPGAKPLKNGKPPPRSREDALPTLEVAPDSPYLKVERGF